MAILLLLVAAVVFWRPLLELPAEFIEVGQAPVPADFIFLLNGDIGTRPAAAARLAQAGYAPRLVVARVADNAANEIGVFPNETDASVRMVHKLGLGDSSIVVLRSEAGVTSTSEEAVALRQYLRSSPADRILVVTNEYHTRRAR